MTNQYKNDYFKEVINRAINHIKPCSENKEELRDTIIWLTVLDIAKIDPERIIGFISGNIKDFASKDKKTLHSRLNTDLIENEVKVIYFTSIEEFIKEQIPKIEKYDLAFFQGILNISDINKEVEQYLLGQKNDLIRTIEREGYEYCDYLEITNLNLNINDITRVCPIIEH